MANKKTPDPKKRDESYSRVATRIARKKIFSNHLNSDKGLTLSAFTDSSESGGLFSFRRLAPSTGSLGEFPQLSFLPNSQKKAVSRLIETYYSTQGQKGKYFFWRITKKTHLLF
ncbi:hypothetical protein [Anaerotignum sp.]|uniref:hypothetical protein n=1 Tax=Anaerotignum sp. TaxID=2039241 RepID=UPI002A90D559|nr:hypothetical protein [Anaerotignum sp.]MCI7658003.1 hypothetical protein [Clostridia bacterium]MDY5414113.1 hypothetical protein [Anaerotignum sp.]